MKLENKVYGVYSGWYMKGASPPPVCIDLGLDIEVGLMVMSIGRLF